MVYGIKKYKGNKFFSNDRRSQQFIDFKDLYIESYFNYVSIINELNNNNNNDFKYSNKLNDLFSFYNKGLF